MRSGSRLSRQPGQALLSMGGAWSSGLVKDVEPVPGGSDPLRLGLRLISGVVAAAGRHGQAEQQAAARGAAGPAGEHGVHRPRAAGVVQGLPQGLPHRPPDRGRVQEDLRQLLPLRRRLQVRRARLPHLRHQRRRHHRLPGVHHRAERDLAGQAGAEAQVGLQHVRPGRQRLHQPQRDAGDRAGHLQNGVLGDENARGRVHSGEANGQDLQADGHQQRWQTVPGRIHQRCQERPLHRPVAAVRPQQREPVLREQASARLQRNRLVSPSQLRLQQWVPPRSLLLSRAQPRRHVAPARPGRRPPCSPDQCDVPPPAPGLVPSRVTITRRVRVFLAPRHLPARREPRERHRGGY
ncbi:hippocalcin-like protein 1 isoform X1 [Lemur catta]|uniref:hippocalcin-like protein 1 isoform X1 n=1 Tax=Lemur catta TaxID=9447 RepID=UPI001E26C8FC|nr:hippocalcin-like protein 1 isoform X1 [Lemur catta]